MPVVVGCTASCGTSAALVVVAVVQRTRNRAVVVGIEQAVTHVARDARSILAAGARNVTQPRNAPITQPEAGGGGRLI